MSNASYPSERGQALILIVLGIIVLLGFTALAIDGSMVYSDRRLAQSVADSTSLAGGSRVAQRLGDLDVRHANWPAADADGTCNGQVLVAANNGLSAAMQRAADNNFTIDTDISDDHGVVAVCGSNPITPAYDELFLDIRAVITHNTDTAFAQFVFSGPLRTTNTAWTRVHPRGPFGLGNAIVALNPEGTCNSNQDGLMGNGGSGNIVNVYGGGLWTNGCLDLDGNTNITVYDAGATYFRNGNSPHFEDLTFIPSVALTHQTDFDEYGIDAAEYTVDPLPQCTRDNEWSSHEIVSFHENDLDNGGDGILDPGLYCITNLLRINSGDYVEGYEVTFYLSNGMTVNGGATVKLTAPPVDHYTGPGIPGVLIYQDPTNHADILINGNEDSIFTGTILAAGSYITFLGNGDTDLTGQIIGWDVRIGGSTTTNVIYDENLVGQRPAYIDLFR